MPAPARADQDLTAAERRDSTPDNSGSLVAVSISACRYVDLVSTNDGSASSTNFTSAFGACVSSVANRPYTEADAE